MQATRAKWILITALGLGVGMIGCNKKDEAGAAARSENGESSAATAGEAGGTEGGAAGTGSGDQPTAADKLGRKADQAGAKTQEEMRQSARDAGEGVDKASSKAKEETRQSARDTKEGAQKAGSRISEEARQTARDIDQGARNAAAYVRGQQPGDSGATEADRQLIVHVRGNLSKYNTVSLEARDIAIKSDKGKIILVGTVTSSEIKADMARHAREVSGVKTVVNDLKVADRVGAGSSD
jgi:osmotically-inducible protein OsmY